MKRKLIALCVLLLVSNTAMCVYSHKIASNNAELFEENQSYAEELQSLRNDCVTLKEICKDQENKLSLIEQELDGVDFDYIVGLPGGMDLKVQIIRQTIGGK